jgi:hypothetical protein
VKRVASAKQPKPRHEPASGRLPFFGKRLR